MNESQFWSYIDFIDRNLLNTSNAYRTNERKAVKPLVNALLGCNEEELHGFQELLACKLYDIDGRVFAKSAGRAGCTDDSFLFARCYTVASGQTFYKAVKNNPSKMPKSTDQWCEPLLYVAYDAWMASGEDKDKWDFSHASVGFETGRNTANW